MNRLIIAASIFTVISSSAALAQGYPHYTPNNPHHVQQNSHYRHDPKPHHSKPAPHRSQWSRGKPLPRQYRGNVVRDYGRHHLAAPPRGYNWVRVNNEYVLIGIATGIISSIIVAQ